MILIWKELNDIYKIKSIYFMKFKIIYFKNYELIILMVAE